MEQKTPHILFISSDSNPFSSANGRDQRYNLILRSIAKVGQVDVISFCDGVVSDIANCRVIYSKQTDSKPGKKGISKFLKFICPWNLYHFFPKDEQKAALVSGFMESGHYDLIVARYLPKALECGLLTYSDRLVIDVDDHPVDVMNTLAKNAGSSVKKKYLQMVGRMMKWSLSRELGRIRFAFFSNPNQAVFKNSAYLPNVPYHDSAVPEAIDRNSHTLLYVAELRYIPNKLGLEHFVNKVFPIVKAAVPSCEFKVAGRYDDEKWGSAISQCDGVELLGFVDDLNPLYNASRVVVVPIYSGAGTNIKVLESLRMKRPCVITEEASRGFSSAFKDGCDYLISKSDSEFSSNIIRLLNDASLCESLSENGYRNVMDNYSKEKFERVIVESLEN